MKEQLPMLAPDHSNVWTQPKELFNHQSEILCNTWRSALCGCISRGCCGFILWLTWGNFSLHSLEKRFLKSMFFFFLLNVILHMTISWDVTHNCHLCFRCLLANLDVCVFIGFCHFIFVCPHIAPLLKATANLSQLRLSLLKWGGWAVFIRIAKWDKTKLLQQ